MSRPGLPLAAVLVAAFAIRSFAADIAPVPHHVVYLHGKIVQEQQSRRPLHEQHGFYELDAIVAAFEKEGFVVTAEVRPKTTSVSGGADRAVAVVRQLLARGVPPDRVTVVGASMGAAIALRTAVRLREPDVRFVVLGPCLSVSIPAIAREEGASPSGRILAIRDESDVPAAECTPWKASHGGASSFTARELVINTGLEHGFLYRPHSAWLGPAIDWIEARGTTRP